MAKNKKNPEEDSFGYKGRGNPYNRFIGKYVSIFLVGQSRSPTGKLIELNEDNVAILNPHQGTKYHADHVETVIINEDQLVHLTGGSIIEPYTKKNLEEYCKYSNGIKREVAKKKIVSKK